MSNIIEVQDLTKRYGTVQAVRGISFYVQQGKLFSFLGPNGAGKSTTIDILCTLLAKDGGTLHIDGLSPEKNAQSIRQRIGVVFQDNMLDALLTVRENLTLRAWFYFKTRAAVRDAVKRAVESTNISEFLNRPYGKLSGGQRRRADIARALLHTPKILFLDEPTTGLDPQSRKTIWDTVQKLKKETGMTVFLTTHYMEEAAQSDYIIIMNKGEIAAKGAPLALKEAYTTDLLRLSCAQRPPVLSVLDRAGVHYTETAGVFVVEIPSTLSALDILTPCKPYLTGFEVHSGTLDDAFIQIIGNTGTKKRGA